MLIEEAIEKLQTAATTPDENEKETLINEVIEALEERKIEPAEKKKKLRLILYRAVEDIQKQTPEIEIEGEPIIVAFPSYDKESRDWIAIFEMIEE